MIRSIFCACTPRDRLGLALLTGMVFLSAVLLFSLEPLVGRLLVPYFGGAIHIWLVCLMFFQMMLLVGYAYAHLWATKLGGWHLLLLLLPLISLPLSVATTPSADAPIGKLMLLLLSRIALPFAVLSTTVVVAQLWMTRSASGSRCNPYPLYGASNAGSLLALLSYPFLIEPFLGLRLQSHLWAAGYGLYCLLALGAYTILRPRFTPSGMDDETNPPSAATPWRVFLLWGGLSALSSAFLLTVTNVIAIEVGSFPMVWIPPLVLYLASFVFTFRDGGFRAKALTGFWPEILLGAGILYLLPTPTIFTIAGHLAILFALCLFIHAELYDCRPDTRHLTGYYLAISVGGFLGGAAVSLGAPLAFPRLYEYPLILLLLAPMLAWHSRTLLRRYWRRATWPIRICRVFVLVTLAVTLAVFATEAYSPWERFVHRNHYGITRIVDYPALPNAPHGLRMMIHAATMHGLQARDREQSKHPALYYHPAGGLGDIFQLQSSPKRITVVGLGSGAVSPYAGPEDILTYYDIDPDMEGIARRWFTYLDDSPAQIRVRVGDGRLALQGTDPGEDRAAVMLIDAFSGDGIPTHLLTREALAVFLRHLAPDGVLVLHLSNRHYDLRPVIKATAATLELSGAFKITRLSPQQTFFAINTVYVALSRDPGNIATLTKNGWTAFGPEDGLSTCKAWTDDYINILAPLREKMKTKPARENR